MENALIEKVKKGDELAFELIFRRYFVRLCGFARKFTRNTQEAEEIVQEAFLKIWERRKYLNPEKEFKPYLFKSVRNLCLNFLDHQKVVDKYYSVIEFVYDNTGRFEYDAFEKLLGAELQTKIEDTIEHLPTECKKVFQMSRNDGLKYSEIAEKLNISIKTVETQMGRALSRLRLEFKEYLTVIIVCLLINH